MRKDLNKLLCEEERYGSSRSYKEVRNRKSFQIDEEEFSAGRESMTKRYSIAGINKNFGEHLNPLYGIVRKNVGRPWDDVYSELSEIFDFRSVINDHILVHLWDYVERYTYIGDDGKVWVRAGRYSSDRTLENAYCQYYIHPVTGVLLKNEKYESWKQSRRKHEEEAVAKKRRTQIVISKTKELRRKDEDSPWFVCDLKLLPVPKKILKEYKSPYAKRSTFREVLPECIFVDKWTGESAKWGSYYCVGYRSASKKDLKEAGLKV